MKSLHNEIMNIQCEFQENMSDSERIAHKIGHRDARHAAAELANEHDAIIEELVEALDGMVSVFGMSDHVLTLNEVIAAKKAIAKAKVDSHE